MTISRLLNFFILTILMLSPFMAFAHEQWLLTPQQFSDLLKQPNPIIFTEFTPLNITLLILALIGTSAWLFIGIKFGKNLFPKWQNKLKHYQPLVPYLLSIFTAATLIIAAFGLIPREGFPRFESPSLFVSDLVLNPLSLSGQVFLYTEIILAVILFLGFFTRFAASVLFILTLGGLYLFGSQLFPYLGFWLGISAYLFLQAKAKPLAQYLLQLGCGLTFMYVGIYYKFMHPQIDIGLLTYKNSFTFGIPYDVFTFCMALIETLSGFLILTGVLLRPLALILFGIFIFMSFLVDENPLAHMFIYGILIAFFINGPAYSLTKARN